MASSDGKIIPKRSGTTVVVSAIAASTCECASTWSRVAVSSSAGRSLTTAARSPTSTSQTSGIPSPLRSSPSSFTPAGTTP